MVVVRGVLGALVMAAGAALQGSVGFGSNLVAAPLLVLLDDRYVPGPVIVASLLLNLLVTRREGGAAVDPGVKAAIAGQVAGIAGAGLVLSSLPADGLSILFAALVLAAVGLSAAGWHLRTTTRSLAGVGVASGFMGTISGIGGPPIALVYQHSPPAALRATLARFFLVGGVLAIPAVALAGKLGADELGPTLTLLPGTVAGFLASGWTRRHLEGRAIRPIVLVLSAASAVAVVVRAIA